MKPLVYLILGAVGSGRRAVVADLLDGGLAEGDRALSLLSVDEPADAADSRLGPVARWSWTNGRIEAPGPEGATHVFFFSDGRRNPVDQVEAFQSWLGVGGGELARVLCVIHCGLAAQHHKLLAWFDACVHFADVVLFSRRDGLPNKWVSGFQRRYTSQFLPCLFELVKDGRVKNPALILVPQARRMSHIFDGELIWEEPEDDEKASDGDEAVELHAEVDPYFERRLGGRRVKELPDIAKYLA